MKLSNIRIVGRYRNEKSGQTVNLHRGRRVGRGDDITFYLRSGKRVIVAEADVYGEWKRVSETA